MSTYLLSVVAAALATVMLVNKAVEAVAQVDLLHLVVLPEQMHQQFHH
jgi:hypothetical protein